MQKKETSEENFHSQSIVLSVKIHIIEEANKEEECTIHHLDSASH